MLTWISEHAKWVIYISIAGIAAGLLFMDMNSLQIDKRPPVGIVNGEKLSNDLFDVRLRQMQSQQSGLSPEQSFQMRENLFRSFVQQSLMQKLMTNAKITPSVYEMKMDLRTDPPHGIDREPSFQTDSVFDFAKYEAWLNKSETYSTPYMIEYENMLKTVKIPDKQLRVFIGAGIHPSTLEAKYRILHRETKFELLYAQGKFSAFDDISVSQTSMDSLFKAEPDSFFVAEDLVKVNYVAIPIEASEKDIESTFEYAKMLLAQIKDGADFAEIARNSSEDPGSAAQGGELGDYTPRGRWVPEFDNVAFALDSGAISEPVHSQFGYHIIQSLGKKAEEYGVELVKARHILLAISATAETIDSLEAILTSIKTETDAGKGFETAAKDKGLNPKLSGWIKKGGEIPELGHIAGLSSFAFFNPLRPKENSKVSDIMQNQKWIVVFEKASSLNAGTRNADFAKQKIEQEIKTKAKAMAIADYLKQNLGKFAEISVLDSASKNSIDKVSIDSISVSFESYLPGLGYATPYVYKALSSAKEGEWSGPYTGNQSAVLLKVLKKIVPKEEMLTAIKDELDMAWQSGSFSAFGDYMRNLEANAKIVNNLDLYYRE
jgi:peptidyl-prolyl cis-trans isomerase D